MPQSARARSGRRFDETAEARMGPRAEGEHGPLRRKQRRTIGGGGQ
jgi:hypothetical protein